ncbi:MAG: ATP-binding protein [Chloroflexota bacterium]
MSHAHTDEEMADEGTMETDSAEGTAVNTSAMNPMIKDSDPFSIPSLKQDINRLQTLTINIVGASFIILYVSLVSIVWRGWKTITQQHDQLQVEIAERKYAEANMAKARDQALEASRLKTQLLAKVSHELRTPLSAILGYAEMLEADIYGSLSNQQKEPVATVIDSANYLTGLVNDLLTQAQLDADKMTLQINPFAPVSVVDDVYAKMNILAQAKGLALYIDIAPDLPATLTGDSTHLEQILINLVGNAIKFTKQGEVWIRLYCLDTMWWCLQVSDTGLGIPVEAQTDIYEPFGQVDGSVTRIHRGSGLGLSIVKQLTTLMEGQITLESKVGMGSTFTVQLPLISNQEK